MLKRRINYLLICIFLLSISTSLNAQVDPDDFLIGLAGVGLYYDDFTKNHLDDLGTNGINVISAGDAVGHHNYYYYALKYARDNNLQFAWTDTVGHGYAFGKTLDYLQAYLDSARVYGKKVMLHANYYYASKADSNCFNGIGTDFTVNENTIYFVDYDSVFSYINNSIGNQRDTLIYGFNFAEESDLAGDKWYWEEDPCMPKLHDTLAVPESRIDEAFSHFNSIINDKKYLFITGFNQWYKTNPTDSSHYWDDCDVIGDDTYSYTNRNYYLKEDIVQAMRDSNQTVYSFIGTEHSDKISVADRKRIFASLYRSLQLEVDGIWFWDYGYSFSNNESANLGSFDGPSDFYADTLQNLTMELDTLVDMGYLPFVDDGSVTVRSSGGSVLTPNKIHARYSETNYLETLIIAVNRDSSANNSHTYAKIYLPDWQDCLPDTTSTVKVLFEDTSENRDYENSHTTTIYKDIQGYYIIDNLYPWSANVYVVPYLEGGGAGDGMSEMMMDSTMIDSTLLGGLVKRSISLPTEFALNEAYPNPFNPETEISYEMPKTAIVKVAIYNVLGQKVRTLVNTSQGAGRYSVKWDGLNDSGQQMSSGVYLVRMDTPGFTTTRKITMLKE